MGSFLRIACVSLGIVASFGSFALANQNGGGGGGVPEIGATAIGSALTVLIGGLLMAAGSRRRNKNDDHDE